MSWIRRLALLGIALLYLLAVPWFREAGAEPRIVFGLPDWTAWTLLCFCGVAVLNAVAWSMTDLEEESDSSAADPPEPSS